MLRLPVARWAVSCRQEDSLGLMGRRLLSVVVPLSPSSNTERGGEVCQKVRAGSPPGSRPVNGTESREALNAQKVLEKERPTGNQNYCNDAFTLCRFE